MANIILVGVDGTDSSRLAARRAAELAVHLGADLHVLTAVEKATVEEFPERPGTSHVTSGELAEAMVAEVAEELRGTVPEVSSAQLSGRPATALVEEAIRLEASLIVVGNRRVQGVSRLLGSVATAVAAHAPCDVYIVKTV